jgi:lysophospholipase L1-like esterase
VRPSQWERIALLQQAAGMLRAVVRERTARLNEEIFTPRLEGARTDVVTPEALAIFERNLHQVAAMNRARGLRTIFVPQVLNASAWTLEQPHSWIPLVAGRDVPRMMAAYNEGLARVGAEEGVPVLSRVLEVDWTPEHFVDHGHFSAAGNALFAETIAPDVQRLCRGQ